MDIPRKSAGKRRLIKRIVFGVVGIAALVAVTLGTYRLKPAAPTVERSTVWIDTVKRGPMNRDVRGLGTLVPEETLLIPATTEGRVERILIRPGTAVKPETVILTLTSPELQTAALNAEYAKQWPNITVKRDAPPDAKDWEGKPGKDAMFSPKPGQGD